MNRSTYAIAGSLLMVLSACDFGDAKTTTGCATPRLSLTPTDTGTALIFFPDPMSSGGGSTLLPTSSKLDQYRKPVTLEHLGRRGVLEGQYVDVRSGLCGGGFGASDGNNTFTYSHSDSSFQDTMAYYFGDQYRKSLDNAGYLIPREPVKIVAHCMVEDNAYYVRGTDASGQPIKEVCLGDSRITPGASYADDGNVTVHELQHSTTGDAYSIKDELNQLWYDEAGSLNEALSDFMSLNFTFSMIPDGFDPKLFSRWALGTFMGATDASRGAHKCPMYDPTYPNCTGYPGFSAERNTISYIYPDGMGWPFTKKSYPTAQAAFNENPSQEEIHNAANLMTGALWDVFESIRALDTSTAAAQLKATKLVIEAVRHLAKPDYSSNVTPVTYRGFADSVVLSAGLLGFSSPMQNGIRDALTARGLISPVDALSPTWLSVGPGRPGTPGIRVLDNPTALKLWAVQMTGSNQAASWIHQGISTGLNEVLDPGETAVIWLDLQNNSDITAGGVRVTLTSTDSDITLLNQLNIGALNSQSAQLQFGKINGSAIVHALSSSDASLNVPTGNSYFQTNPYYNSTWKSAFWIQVAGTAPHGKTVQLQVSATPSNGSTSTINIPVVIH